ncbi:hypothetical protein BJ875DRAFT_475881 [Amylocarpus encephaloides]|uniref:C2H2-type domain-containing protein n=1 Tax=Amylocarpus encephaloides TaxID=45428 RepID=A0A9P7Y8L1_9HELO|nr:hypothetical protein BJ875DRAFT_475881 [Amylocarpus encephaloides]
MSNPVYSTSAELPKGASPVLPEQLKPFLTLLDDPLGLPVCLLCQNAVLPKSLMDHFRKQHNIPTDIRPYFRSLVSTLPSLEPSDLPSKPHGSRSLRTLRVIKAFQCKECPFIRQDVTDVRKHINKEHNNSAAGNYDEIPAQTWLSGRRAVYWRVEVGTPDPEDPPCVWGFYGTGFGSKTPKTWSKEQVENSKV